MSHAPAFVPRPYERLTDGRRAGRKTLTEASRSRRSGRLELTWTNKDWRLLDPEGDGDWSWDWVPPSDYRVAEVRLLREAGGIGEPGSGNLLIRGDALHALGSLTRLPGYSEHHLGQVKLAYLDPPFSSSQWSRYYDEAVEHSYWLTLMRDRLEQVRELLAPDGSVWVHCDDYEQAHLKVLMDELFGRSSFVATIVWERRYTQSSDATISLTHDYLLIYASDPRVWKTARNPLPRTEKQDKAYKNPDNDPRGPWKAASLISPNYRRSGDFLIIAPNGRQHRPPEGTSWRYPRETYDALLTDNRIWWGTDGNNTPAVKTFLSQVAGVVPKTWWPHEDAGHTDLATREMKALFPGVAPFATAKPEKLIERVIHIGSDPGDLVLDPFLGSGTTAAVAHKMGRRWVGVERSRDTVETYAAPRLRKVVEGSDPGGITDVVDWEGGGGFRVLDVRPSMFEDDEGQVVLADWATNGMLAEATAAQLGFAYEPDPPLSGRKGRTRLAVIDGHVSGAVVGLLVDALDEGELLTVCGTSVDPQAVDELRTLRPSSRVRKIPDSLLAEYQETHRWRPRSVEAPRPDWTPVAATATAEPAQEATEEVPS